MQQKCKFKAKEKKRRNFRKNKPKLNFKRENLFLLMEEKFKLKKQTNQTAFYIKLYKNKN